jgi:hypothetical protein
MSETAGRLATSMGMSQFTRVVIALAIATGCSKGSTDRPTSVSDEMVATADKFAGALDKFASDLEAAGSDCGKAVEAVKASSDAGRALAADIDAVRTKTSSDPAAKEWFKKTYESRMEQAFERVKMASGACITDNAFMAALEGDELMPRKRVVK